MEGIITLVPTGAVSQDLLQWLKDALASALPASVTGEVRPGDPIPLSPGWYHSERDQYLGSEILHALLRVPRREQDRVLGLADVDCYARGLNFIFGQAAPRLGVAFVALPRLRQSFYGLAKDRALFRQRALKEVVHELGHTWGLQHCDDPRCVMHFSNTLADTDAKAATFCERCARQLDARPGSGGAVEE